MLGDLHMPELRVDCHTQKDIAPMKRAAWTQSLTGLPFSKMAEAIMATAHAMAQSTRVVNRFVDDLPIDCF